MTDWIELEQNLGHPTVMDPSHLKQNIEQTFSAFVFRFLFDRFSIFVCVCVLILLSQATGEVGKMEFLKGVVVGL